MGGDPAVGLLQFCWRDLCRAQGFGGILAVTPVRSADCSRKRHRRGGDWARGSAPRRTG